MKKITLLYKLFARKKHLIRKFIYLCSGLSVHLCADVRYKEFNIKKERFDIILLRNLDNFCNWG